ncbi:MAG: hypothetical protein QRY16_10155 [Enterobacterales bacterium endosymbiont of Blomia tropicalis]|nr:hypothetical protein [Mixta mediterraneensis]MDL4914127.1 hypothetical protein [Mixta mediterraneensis]
MLDISVPYISRPLTGLAVINMGASMRKRSLAYDDIIGVLK